MVSRKTRKAVAFIQHIEKHLEQMFGKGHHAKVECKICGKNIDSIYREVERESLHQTAKEA